MTGMSALLSTGGGLSVAAHTLEAHNRVVRSPVPPGGRPAGGAGRVSHITHRDIQAFAEDRVNLPKAQADINLRVEDVALPQHAQVSTLSGESRNDTSRRRCSASGIIEMAAIITPEVLVDDQRAGRVPLPIELVLAVRRMFDDQVRQAAPQPFGLAGDTAPRPAALGRTGFSGSARGGVPGPSLGELISIVLCYGIRDDPGSPYIEVLTDFTPDHSDSVNVRIALGRAAAAASPVPRPITHPRQLGRVPKGPLPRAPLEIMVAGKVRTVTTTSYQGYNGLQFSQSGRTVTAIARGHWTVIPAFTAITDLEQHLSR